jgi:hypothetical protein
MSLLMLLCPVGMAAMGGITWVLTRLPGKGTDGSHVWPGGRSVCRCPFLNRDPQTTAARRRAP